MKPPSDLSMLTIRHVMTHEERVLEVMDVTNQEVQLRWPMMAKFLSFDVDLGVTRGAGMRKYRSWTLTRESLDLLWAILRREGLRNAPMRRNPF